MVLYGSHGAPWTRKVLIAMAEKGLACDRVLDAGGRALPAPAELAPLGKTPVLVLDDGTALFDSAVIVEWLEHAHPLPALLPVDVLPRARARRWEALADGLADLGIAVTVGEEQAASRERRVTLGLEALARGLGEAPYCLGDGFSLADIAVGSYLKWHELRTGDAGWRDAHPTLARLSDRLEARPSFALTLYRPGAPSAR